MADNNNSNNVVVSWQTIIGAVLIIFTVLGAGWSLFQAQFSYIDRDKELIRAEISRRESELKDAIKSINVDLEQRRQLFVNQTEFREFRERITERVAMLEEQNRFVRESKPTNADLASIRERIKDIEERQKQRPMRSEIDALFKSHDGQMKDSMTALRREIDMFQKEVDRLLSVQLQQLQQTPLSLPRASNNKPRE